MLSLLEMFLIGIVLIAFLLYYQVLRIAIKRKPTVETEAKQKPSKQKKKKKPLQKKEKAKKEEEKKPEEKKKKTTTPKWQEVFK